MANIFQADGRIIKVYPKPGGYKARDSPFSGRQASSTRDQVVDGSLGFPDRDLMDAENVPPPPRSSSRLHYAGEGHKHAAVNRRGRGFQKGASGTGR